MQVQWRALSLAVNKLLKASIPTRAFLVGKAAAEVEMPAGNNSPATEPQCWTNEGKKECNSSNYSSKRQKQPQSQTALQGSALRASSS